MRAILLCLLIGCSFFQMTCFASEHDHYFDDSITIKELALKNNIPPSKLMTEIKDELGIVVKSGNDIVRDVGLTDSQFKKIYLHINDSFSPVIIIGMFLWILMGVWTVYLLKNKKLTINKRIILFLISIVFFGIILHAHPSAMESVVKFFKATAGKESWQYKIIFLTFFTIFSFVASNLFCSIGCQIGSIQDLLFQMFRRSKIRFFKIPFLITNSIRFIVFIFFIMFMYNFLSGLETESLYHGVNIFKLYIWGLGLTGVITLVVTIAFSGFVYRPFCSLICPFGIWSWITSQLAFFKIRIKHEDCIKCKKCLKVCPNNAMDSIFNKKLITTDCYSCGECINNCPTKCIHLT